MRRCLAIAVLLGACWSPVKEHGACDGLDGGALTKPCPLTLGVCAGSVSVCRDGRWQPCDYGADYELTERRCDGLDNDCDGRPDVSWQRTLLLADGGWYSSGAPLISGETMIPLVLARDAGFWIGLPSGLLVTDTELTVQQRIDFPRYVNNHAYLFPDGDNWLRFTGDFPAGFSEQICMLAHHLNADGTSVGGEVPVRHCWSHGYQDFRAAPVDDGWLGLVFVNQSGVGLDVGWAWYGRDGGSAHGMIDAGLSTQSHLAVQRGRFVITGPSGGFELNTASRELVASPAFCYPVDTTPPAFMCPDSQWNLWSAWSEDGGQLIPEIITNPSLWAPSDDLFVVVGDAGVGGTLAAFRNGRLVEITSVPSVPGNAFGVHNVSGRLHLATFDGPQRGGLCPACTIAGFYAEYVCAPP